MADIINEAIYTRLAEQVKALELRMISALDMRNSLREVGIDTADIDKTIRDTEAQIGRWKSLLINKGFLV